MDIFKLKETLINFAENPSKSWGRALDGCGNDADLETGYVIRTTVENGDRNTARLNSGTYTSEQYVNFVNELKEIEMNGYGKATISGDPDSLPNNIPSRICNCGKIFRSIKTERDVKCYKCNLDKLCPPLPGRHFTAYWRRDDWKMKLEGDIGFKNKMTYNWYNTYSYNSTSHQELIVYRKNTKKINKITLGTVARVAKQFYFIEFDIANRTTKFARVDNVKNIRTEYISNNSYSKFIKMEKFDNIVMDLVQAMIPHWMIYEHK